MLVNVEPICENALGDLPNARKISMWYVFDQID